MCSYVNSKYPKKKLFSQTILQFICRQYKQELNSVIVVCSRKKARYGKHGFGIQDLSEWNTHLMRLEEKNTRKVPEK